jgi:hypothetical protein
MFNKDQSLEKSSITLKDSSTGKKWCRIFDDGLMQNSSYPKFMAHSKLNLYNAG